MNLYIFDLDGTLANVDHRKHFIEDKQDKNRHDKFYESCELDKPIKPTIALFNELLNNSDVYIFTGRRIEVREKTIDWLLNNTSVNYEYLIKALFMRNIHDRRSDTEVKCEMYDGLSKSDKGRLVGVFEDRTQLVNMWRELGLTCFQVADGDF